MKTKHPLLNSGVWRINGESHSQRWYVSRVIRGGWCGCLLILITTTTNPITTYYQH